MDKIVIREFCSCQEDKKLVNDFFDNMGFDSKMFFNRGDGNRQNALKFFDGTLKNHTCWMAVQNGKMVGYVFLWDVDKGVVWFGIAVSDELKGKGLGRKLAETAIDYAKDNGKGGVMLTTHCANFRGQALYEKCGFKKIGTDPSGEYLYLLNFDK